MTHVTSYIGTRPYQVIHDNGHLTWLADEPTDVGGGDTGPAPFELLLSSLGACTSITLKMYAARKGWALTEAEVTLTLASAPGESPGSIITRRIALHGELDDTQRARLLQIANACPVHKLLSQPISIESSLAD